MESKSIGIIGTGKKPFSLGWRLVEHIYSDSNLDKKIKLYLHNRSEESLDILRNAMPSKENIEIERSDVEGIAKKADVSLICVDGNTTIKDRINSGDLPERIETLIGNIKPIREIAEKFGSSYNEKGQVIVLTNPLDIATYLFCIHSRLPVSKVVGFDSDSERFESKVMELAKKKGYAGKIESMNVFAIGGHGPDMVPVGSQVLQRAWRRLQSPSFTREEIEKIKQEAIRFGTESVLKLKQYPSETTITLKDFCFEVLYGSDKITSKSTYLVRDKNKRPIWKRKGNQIVHPNGGLFIGWPIRIENGYFVPVRELEGPNEEKIPFNLTREEETAFAKSYNGLEKILNDVREGHLELDIPSKETPEWLKKETEAQAMTLGVPEKRKDNDGYRVRINLGCSKQRSFLPSQLKFEIPEPESKLPVYEKQRKSFVNVVVAVSDGNIAFVDPDKIERRRDDRIYRSLRSANTFNLGGNDLVFFGLRYGVVTYDPKTSSEEKEKDKFIIKELEDWHHNDKLSKRLEQRVDFLKKFYKEEKMKLWGVNSMAVYGKYLITSHTMEGIVAFDIQSGREILFNDLFEKMNRSGSGIKHVRGAKVHGNELYFIADNKIMKSQLSKEFFSGFSRDSEVCRANEELSDIVINDEHMFASGIEDNVYVFDREGTVQRKVRMKNGHRPKLNSCLLLSKIDNRSFLIVGGTNSKCFEINRIQDPNYVGYPISSPEVISGKTYADETYLVSDYKVCRLDCKGNNFFTYAIYTLYPASKYQRIMDIALLKC